MIYNGRGQLKYFFSVIKKLSLEKINNRPIIFQKKKLSECKGVVIYG